MMSKKRLSKGSNLCVILDKDLCGKNILKIAKAAASAGCGMIQFRCKICPATEAVKIGRAIKRITDRYHIPLIVNDRLDVACAIDSEGIHLGQGDLSVRLAREIIGKDRLIGISVTNLKQARLAKKAGADYLGAGPIFETPIKSRKPKGIRLLKEVSRFNMPVFAIGGIDRHNVRKLTGAGFNNAAVIRSVCCAASPAQAVRDIKKAL